MVVEFFHILKANLRKHSDGRNVEIKGAIGKRMGVVLVTCKILVITNDTCIATLATPHFSFFSPCANLHLLYFSFAHTISLYHMPHTHILTLTLTLTDTHAP